MLKRNLVIGLGNPLLGDDAIGLAVAQALDRDPRLSGDYEVLVGGTDLTQYADCLTGRDSITVVDAVLSDEEPGTVTTYESPVQRLEQPQVHSQHLSGPELTTMVAARFPALGNVRWEFITVAVPSVEPGLPISPGLERRLPRITEETLRILGESEGVTA